MSTSLLNFDWWVLVIVPAAVTIAVNYIQRGLDFTTKNFLPSMKRRRLRNEIKDTLRILRRMSDGTLQYTIVSLVATLIVRSTGTIFLLIILVSAFDQYVRDRSYLVLAIMFAVEIPTVLVLHRLNGTIARIYRYNRVYNRPVEIVQALRVKQATILEDEFGDLLQGAEMLTTRLMAARIQQLRDTLGEFERGRLEPLFMRDCENGDELKPK